MMKRNITKIFAALALLVFMTPSMVALADNVTILPSDGTPVENSAYTITKTPITASVTASTLTTDQIRVFKNQTITIASTSATITNIVFTCTANGTTKYGPGCLTTRSGYTYETNGPHGTWTGSSNSIVFTASSNQARITQIVVTYTNGGGQQPTTYTVTYDGNGNDSGTAPTDSNSPYNANATVTVLGNTGNLAKTDYTWAGWNTAADGTGTDYAAGATFNISANTTLYAKWTANGGSNPGLDVDFESALTTYSDWQFTNIVKTNSDITAHGGTYFGSNANSNGNATTTASIQTTTAIANPQSLTCYVSKRSNNTTSSTWYIQVSSDGTTWTDVNTQSASSMSKGTWVEFTANLTSYSNVYVRVYYDGSNALRAIDDISLTTMPTTPTITFTPASIDLGNVAVGQPITETFTVSQANLTAGITLSASAGTLSTQSIAQGAAATQVTWTYTPATAGAINATIAATSGTLTETLGITGTAKAAHTVTINAMMNGSVTASANTAIEGETITLTATPNSGYYLYVIDATGQTSQATPTGGLTLHTNGTFSFTMPDENVYVGATFNQVSPMTVTEALAATLPLNHYVCVTGIVSGFYGNNSSVIDDNSHRYYISVDGTSASQLLVYNGTGLNHAAFNNASDLEIGDQVVVWGDLIDYNSTRELAKGNYLVSRTQPASITVNPATISLAADEMDGTTNITFTSLVISQPWDDCHVTFYTDANGTTVAAQPDWVVDALVAEDNNAYVVSCAVDANEGPARTAYFKVYAYDANQNAVYSNMITLSQAAVAIPTSGTGGWERVTSINQLTDGSKVIIAARYNSTTNSYYAMPSAFSPSHGKVDGVQFNSTTSGNAEVLPASLFAGEHNESYYYWTVNIINNGQDYTFTNASGDTIACLSGETDFYWSRSYDYEWRITSSTAGNGALVPGYTGFVISNRDVTNRAFAFNGSKFGSYNTTNINSSYNFYLDFFIETSAAVSYTKTILPYTANAQTPDRYYLIASPVECAEPTAANGFLANNYDLYRFDQAKELEWLNYETTPFYLLSGKGYLYANSGNNGNSTTLTFTGTAYSGNGQVTLSKVSGASWEGWNLIGNPYATAAVLKDAAGTNNQAYYKMNSTGTEIEAGTLGGDIADMEGVFVIAANDGDVVTFVPSNNGKSSQLCININNSLATVDRAIVRFDEGSQLPKFQLNPDHTKVYIPQNDRDYAVVRSASEGEMPVSFKAETNGTYTLSTDITELEVTYLHLIDNLTGADVDLLATPSYTFNANTTDYASRFKLVFKAGTGIDENASTSETNFAFFNGTEWVVNNEGNATLQVIDMTGRMVSNTEINGNTTVNINEAAGLYMLRLVNGDNVKVQKIVVR